MINFADMPAVNPGSIMYGNESAFSCNFYGFINHIPPIHLQTDPAFGRNMFFCRTAR